MSTEIKVPVFPESVEEGTMMAWLKQPGEAIGVDEKVAEVETDKVVLDVIAPLAGVLEKILKQEGETVQGGEAVAVLGEGSGVAAAPAPPPPAAKAPAPEPAAPPPEKPAPAPEPPKAAPAPAAPPPETPSHRGEAAIGPAARKLLQEKDIDSALVKGSGRDGRVTKTDVLNYIATQEERKANGGTASPIASPPPMPSPSPSRPAPSLGRHEERIPMSRLRARIAERLVEAQQTAAILTTFNEVDMKPVMDLRNKYKADFEKQHGVRLGFMSFFVTAAIEALKRFPSVNGSIEGDDIIHHHYYDIGVAVSSPRGLVVPVLRDADQMSFAEIEAGVRELGVKASENRLSMDDLTGGTFTISNGGVFGSMLSTPILNPPQSGILGMHNIVERPVAVDGQVVIHPVMYLALSYDHRIIDGREAVSSLVTIKELLEDPARLLLQV